MRFHLAIMISAASLLVASTQAQTIAPADGYKLLHKVAVGGEGGYDYVYADAPTRKLYIPRSNRVDIFDLDTLKPAGAISPADHVHGAVVDQASRHGFCSSSPVVMWDSDSLKILKTIPVKGRPDGILLDPATRQVLILSHSSPNVTFINVADGSIAGTLDLGGEPEQGASDGQGKLYISLENMSKVAVVDSQARKVTATYDLAPKGGSPAGLALDAKNHILFVSGREPDTCVIMNADDGKMITTLPIGNGVDSSEFDPETMETFVSTRDGKLTVIKETDPKTFSVEQTVDTLAGARTSTLDAKTNRVILVANDPSKPASKNPATAPAPAQPPAARQGRGRPAPGTFTILVVGKPAQ